MHAQAIAKANFNPRSREGSDSAILHHRLHLVISIHAPAKGATRQQRQHDSRTAISIHAPAKGATVLLWQILTHGCYFNPRSREGSDVWPRHH